MYIYNFSFQLMVENLSSNTNKHKMRGKYDVSDEASRLTFCLIICNKFKIFTPHNIKQGRY